MQPVILVIVGITGDLARRKVLPAIAALKAAGRLPALFHLVGVTRQVGVDRDTIFAGVDGFGEIRDHCSLYSMDVANPLDYEGLATYIASIERGFGTATRRLVYLSVPPTAAYAMIEHLATLNATLVLEKPFGTDVATAQELIDHIAHYFSEDNIYRVDHYLAKPMLETVHYLKTAHPLSTYWNTRCISRIEVCAFESLSIEGRVVMYEQTGALRDIIQSHLLEVLAVTIADEATPDAKVRRAHVLASINAPTQMLRGQYIGYKDDVGNTQSNTETFAALELSCALWPTTQIVLATGKSMHRKVTMIQLHIAPVYRDEVSAVVGTLPEGVSYRDGVISIDIARGTNAYERIFAAAMAGDTSLFVSAAEVLESWRIVSHAQDQWGQNTADIVQYDPASGIEGICRADWCAVS